MQVAVDGAKCQGHARCNLICPSVFDLDEQGHAFVSAADVPAGMEEAVQQAARSCPEGAISLKG